MNYALHIVSTVVVTLLSVIQLAMLVRAILSWFPMEESRFSNFLYGITEPVIYPVRALFIRMNWFQQSPLDMSFMVTFLLLSLLTTVLSL